MTLILVTALIGRDWELGLLQDHEIPLITRCSAMLRRCLCCSLVFRCERDAVSLRPTLLVRISEGGRGRV